MRPRARTLALTFALAATCGTALADFPDQAPQPPTERLELSDRSDPNGAPRPVNPAAGGSPAPLRLPARVQTSYQENPSRNEMASDVSSVPRLPLREPARPPAVESLAPKPSEPTSGMPVWLSGAASLGLVLGLFLLVVWAVRRGMPRNAGVLPREALEVLGRAPLVGRQQVHLVRCGNKILLLCVSATNVQTITEITDSAEVARLAAICQRTAPAASLSFRQAIGQLGRQRDDGYLTDEQAEELDFGQDDDLVRGRLGGLRV